ncbi:MULTISPECIES: HNH endonuclease signature motif containing protein [Pseudomonas]|uniref:HNH endonuclease signature motif containing protein n=1 Tax=Pseudomonas TaxID=286 RepID=UPI00061449D5|nr:MULTISPECIES: HNH endonuclease signature motif containing protein [Pseudomonas]MDT3230137.1 HNH endonuclease signature motif containing protein [Pseudomonas sp. rhizo25]
MAITEKSIKLIWSNAAGRCSFTGCTEKLTVEQAAESAPHTLGEMAHIKGRRKDANRYDATQNDVERDDYENLILLCPNHHTLIDKKENEEKFPVEFLLEMKICHETYISSKLNAIKYSTLEELKDNICIYLSENHQSWLQYGPLSENAQRNPHSDKLHALWLSERLTTIVPNNRIITSLIKENQTLFPRLKQKIVGSFLTHASSYEKWVHDEIPYEAVLRFPAEFENLIMES